MRKQSELDLPSKTIRSTRTQLATTKEKFCKRTRAVTLRWVIEAESAGRAEQEDLDAADDEKQCALDVEFARYNG